MADPRILISVKEFCPQMTLPCEKGTAYPDPYSCQHFYYCDKNGEIRRYTCGANGWIRIVEGAALCGTQKLSTCDDNRPRRQCDSLNGYLPDEYCEVLAPGRVIWTYPDPEGCQGYYKYSPPDLTRMGDDLVVERLSCRKGTYYSPSGETCTPVTENPDSLCGGKWIYQSEDCRMIKLKPNTVHTSRVEDVPSTESKSEISPRTSKLPPTTVPAGNVSMSSAPPLLVPYNGLTILAWVVGLAAALVLLITIVTVIMFMLQKRRRKRLLQNRSPNLPESSGAHVMNISRPMSFAELNEYAAIDDVFGNTLERSRSLQTEACVADSHVTNGIDAVAPTSSRAVPDGYGSSGAPKLPPRPKSTPSYTNPERRDLKSHKSVGCCANQPITNDILCNPEETPKSFCNVNWQTALNASMPDESYSSDEYEAISFTPLMTPEPPPDDSVKGKDADCNEKIDNQEYMIPVISHTNVEVTKSTSATEPRILTVSRRTKSLPHKLPLRRPSLKSDDHTTGLVPVVVPDKCINETVGVVYSNSNNTDSINSSITRDEIYHEEEEPKESNGQPNGQDDDYFWNISDSWIRCDKKQKASTSALTVSNLPCDLDAAPEIECPSLPEESLDVDKNYNTSNDIVDNANHNVDTDEKFQIVCISPAPEGHSETSITVIDEPTNIASISKENTKPLNECEESGSTHKSEESTKSQTDGVSKLHPLGYEILVTASSPTDFRVYQYLSADSESSSSSTSDLQSIPDIQLSVIAGQGSTKNHEYYVLDKHHSSDTSVELQCDGQKRNWTVFEPKQRQSCNF